MTAMLLTIRMPLRASFVTRTFFGATRFQAYSLYMHSCFSFALNYVLYFTQRELRRLFHVAHSSFLSARITRSARCAQLILLREVCSAFARPKSE
jgi:hypothetical protein